MGRTLLIGSPQTSWRDWHRHERGRRDLLCLDPADPEHGHLARVVLLQRDRPVFTRFYGSLDPQRAPHVLLTALARALPGLADDAVVQLFAYRATPTLRQVVQLAAELIQPAEVLAPAGLGVPLAAKEIELERGFTPNVQQAQRKAHWIKLREQSERHEVDLRGVAVQGARLMSGEVVSEDRRATVGLGEALHVERQGSTLFVVAAYDPEEGEVVHALDSLACSRAAFVHPEAYVGLLCSFARGAGEDFGTGFIESVDWPTLRATVSADAVPPAPVQTLRLGSLRVDPNGNELPELRPWQA